MPCSIYGALSGGFAKASQSSPSLHLAVEFLGDAVVRVIVLGNRVTDLQYLRLVRRQIGDGELGGGVFALALLAEASGRVPRRRGALAAVVAAVA